MLNTKTLQKVSIASSVAAFSLLGGVNIDKVNAATITVGGTDYNITTVEGSYNDLSGTLVDQVWWGDQALALSFANALGTDLGLPNSSGTFSPLFSFQVLFGRTLVLQSAGFRDANNTALIRSDVLTGSRTFAIATPVTQPVPEPLTILGAGAAIAFGTHFKRKVKNNSEKTV